MLSKNVSREEWNTIEAIHAKRMIVARLGGSFIAVEAVMMTRATVNGVVPGPLRVSLMEMARWCVGNQRFRMVV